MPEKKDPNKINASPTKSFFVEMLTRDIELEDAILDLIDNCMDGVHRILNARQEQADRDTPYAGFSCEIKFDQKSFTILDNCGGMSREIARESAFRMGRPDDTKSVDNAVGTYGIGMKRAIFKMGTKSIVRSKTENESFKVDITSEWIKSDSWELRLEDTENNFAPGLQIEVTDLLDGIANRFSNNSFENDIINRITNIYSIIILKGFSIKVNNKTITAEERKILWDGDQSLESGGIAPYIYIGQHDDVIIKVVVGLYRPLPSEEEKNDGLLGKYKTDSSGWSVICNERVVLYNDKTRLTGWGTQGIPSYHTQFISIFGIVSFESTNPRNLPVGTTKRSLDLSSEIWTLTLERMKEGMKIFTTYTNKWKEDLDKQRNLSKEASLINPLSIISKVSPEKWTKPKGSNDKKFIPSLPLPPTKRQSSNDRTIRFSKSISDIEAVSQFLFEFNQTDQNLVGKTAFEYVLELAKE